jgi:hypothetical protein
LSNHGTNVNVRHPVYVVVVVVTVPKTVLPSRLEVEPFSGTPSAVLVGVDESGGSYEGALLILLLTVDDAVGRTSLPDGRVLVLPVTLHVRPTVTVTVSALCRNTDRNRSRLRDLEMKWSLITSE